MDSIPRHPGATTAPGGRWRDSLAVWPQYILPHHAISRLIHAITRSRRGWLKDRLIRWFIRRYGVDMTEARSLCQFQRLLYPRPEAGVASYRQRSRRVRLSGRRARQSVRADRG